jgi:Holliday junction resolvase-like predicted endonuclease
MSPISISAIFREATPNVTGQATARTSHQVTEVNFASTVDQIQRGVKAQEPVCAPMPQHSSTERPAAVSRTGRATRPDRKPVSDASREPVCKLAACDAPTAIPGCLNAMPDVQARSVHVSNGEESQGVSAADSRDCLRVASSGDLSESELAVGVVQSLPHASHNADGAKSEIPSKRSTVNPPSGPDEVKSVSVAPESHGEPHVLSLDFEPDVVQAGEKQAPKTISFQSIEPEPKVFDKVQAQRVLPPITEINPVRSAEAPDSPSQKDASVGQKNGEPQSPNSTEANSNQPSTNVSEASPLVSIAESQPLTDSWDRLDQTPKSSFQLQPRTAPQVQVVSDPSVTPQGATIESDPSDRSQDPDGSSSESEPQPVLGKDRRTSANGATPGPSASDQNSIRGSSADSAGLNTQSLAGGSPASSSGAGISKTKVQAEHHGTAAEQQRAMEPAETKFAMATTDTIKRGEIHVSLQSETLGLVELRARVHGENVAASIAVDKKATQQLLSDALPSLHQALSDRRLRLDQISIRQSASDVSGQSSQPQQRDSSNPEKAESNLTRLTSLETTSVGSVVTNVSINRDEGIFDTYGRLSVRV